MVFRRRLVCLLAAGLMVLPLHTVLPASAAPGPTVTGLRTNSLENPLGIGGSTPRLSWQLDADRRGVTQTRYEVRVASTAEVDRADVWTSGVVTSDQSVDVSYGGPALTSHTRYHWSVRVWDDRGTASAWSPVATFETGLLDAADWTADWIGASNEIGPEWTDYTVDLDFTLEDTAFGVFFRGHEGIGYMWQINGETPGTPKLRPHVRNPGGGYVVLGEVPLSTDLTKRHNLRITVAGTTITTYLDGAQVDQRTRGDHNGPGIVGLRTSGAEQAVIHRLSVVNAAGTTLVDTAFPPGDSTFESGTVLPGGGLRISGGDSWLSGAPLPVFRKDLTVGAGKQVVSARIHAAARGVYQLRLNGTKVGDHELAPGWTDYNTRIQHQTYDVTDLLAEGANTLGAEVAPGWFTGNIAMFGRHKYGTDTSVIAQLRIVYADGSVDVVGTDDSWRTTPGAIRSADLLDGENYDARRAAALKGWDKPRYDAAGWDPAVVRPTATDKLEPQDDQPVRVTQELAAKAIPSPTPGAYLYDLGQNMVGKARFSLTGVPGRQVRIRYGEVLNPDGSLYTANLRSAKATDYYTFATARPETFSPTFTFHGYRYIEITGLDAAPRASQVKGVVMGTDGDLTSTFESSSAMVNKLHSNIVWGQRGNFLSIPTDTPARDERLGWTGDINVFARTAVYNMDSQAFLTKWLKDLRDTQRADGAYASIAPVVPNAFDAGFGNAGWSDAGVNVPWTLWQAYGDLQVVRDNYDSMTRYVDYLVASSNNLIRDGGAYNDWLNLDDPTPSDLVGTSFVAKGARQLSELATALGRTADAARYAGIYADVRAAFQAKFVAADGKVGSDSQTGYILAFTSDLIPDDKVVAAGNHFANTIARRDYHLSTGFLGVDGLLPVLTKIGRTDLAYRLLQNTGYPSWGYEIGKGATTIWERWNSINPDGTFNDVGMNSFNHYAYGAAGEWMYRTLAGVSALEPGYRSTLVAPQPGAGIDSVDFSHDTRYGTVRSGWQTRADGGLVLETTVPGNTTATVRLPADNVHAVTEGGTSVADAAGVRDVVDDGATVSVTVGSGRYRFVVDPGRSALGVGLAATGTLAGVASDLATAGSITAADRAHVDTAVREVRTDVGRALDATGPAAANHAARALDTTYELRAWIAARPYDAATKKALGDAERAVSAALADAVRRLVGISAEIRVGPGEHLPGDVVPVTVRVSNASGQSRPQVAAGLTAPDGWKVVGHTEPRYVPARGSADFRFSVTVADSAPIAAAPLAGTVDFAVSEVPVRLGVAGALPVASPVTVTAVADPATGEPGTTATVRATLHNRSATPVSGTLAVAGPTGWTAPEPAAVTVAPGKDLAVAVPVTVPLEGNAGAVDLALTLADGSRRLATATAAFGVTQSLTPANPIDYVDLGDAASEAAHRVTASPSSGTSVEAGRTRRYSGVTSPGSWYEFDLAVTPGKPFLVRVVETYDRAQTKDYQLLANGTVVHTRLISRGSAGLETYQFLVDDPALLTGPTVRIRAQYNAAGTGYDPSIADIWSLPVP